MNCTKSSSFSLPFFTFYILIQIYHQRKIYGTPPNVSCPLRSYSSLYFSRAEFTWPLIHTREYVLVNSLQLKLSIASKWASKHLWGTIYFDVDSTFAWHFLHWTSMYAKSHCTMYRKLFHVSAVKIISKCSDKICRQGQVFSHFAYDFSRLFKFNRIMLIYIYILSTKEDVGVSTSWFLVNS